MHPCASVPAPGQEGVRRGRTCRRQRLQNVCVQQGSSTGSKRRSRQIGQERSRSSKKSPIPIGEGFDVFSDTTPVLKTSPGGAQRGWLAARVHMYLVHSKYLVLIGGPQDRLNILQPRHRTQLHYLSSSGPCHTIYCYWVVSRTILPTVGV